MQTSKSSEKREKSVAEFILVIILLGFLMKLFIGYYFSQEENITKAGFKTLAQNFKNTVVVVHAQWQMDNRPPVVSLSGVAKQDKAASVVRVSVNEKGWLDTERSSLVKHNITACEHIWQLAMSMPMSLMKFSVAAIEIHNERLSNYHQCRYILSTGDYFEYYSATGQVTQVYGNDN
ncbi:hypothetical protein KO495_00320 [Colwellia sp. D2M02]|uniref:hypothetical protein n=1 Tax=Colwellia sp. D2M02 TaxID=2841562 RepID=UPI001C0A1CC0|nr:hypothetical protein [Colwellia sp. D2M02]MBU2891761.1 hypothetical protein [Colwellia sp. D2M02]